MALYLTLLGLGWLLAAGSGVLWFRKHPGRHLGWASPNRGWRSEALLVLAIAVAAYGGTNLQVHQHWDARWVAVAVMFPIGVFAGVLPRIVRWRQLRRPASQPAGLGGSAGIPPAV